MTESIRIRTIDGNLHSFHYNDIFRYDFEYTPNVLRIDFKDGSFVEFTRQNIIFAEIDVVKGADIKAE